jgi:uncharacterized protein YutE (UPF0331/DUF86 family)
VQSRPLDRDRVNNQLRRLEAYLHRLEALRSNGKEKFLSEDILEAATERNLQLAIDTLLNLGNHIVAIRGLRLPEEYADIFRILAEEKILNSDLVPRYVEMAKFRDKLVHFYEEIDKEQVWKILENDLGDISAFQHLVLGLLKEQAENDGGEIR